MATITARLFAGAERAALSTREATSWFVQSTITASKRCRVIFCTAESGSRQCSTPISNSLSTRRSTRTTLSSSHRSRACRPGCTVYSKRLTFCNLPAKQLPFKDLRWCDGYSGNHAPSFKLDQSHYFQQLAVKDTKTLLTLSRAEVESGSSDGLSSSVDPGRNLLCSVQVLRNWNPEPSRRNLTV